MELDSKQDGQESWLETWLSGPLFKFLYIIFRYLILYLSDQTRKLRLQCHTRPRVNKNYHFWNMTHSLSIHSESFLTLLISRIFTSNSGKRIKSTKPILFKKETTSQSLKMKNWSSNCKSWRHHRNTDYDTSITSKTRHFWRETMTNRLFKKVEWPYWELPPPGQV